MKEKILYVVLFFWSAYVFCLPSLSHDYNEILENVNAFTSININRENKLVPKIYGRSSLFSTTFNNKNFNKEEYLMNLEKRGWKQYGVKDGNCYKFKRANQLYIIVFHDNGDWSESIIYEK
ncbi:hypothetical protein [Phascolarctobacterium succinatutens]|uniref:hypothetical protein n=1 Tax=Phascolarctobacterium succinatutens TaxID=626940 RepID=UPI00307BC6D1